MQSEVKKSHGLRGLICLIRGCFFTLDLTGIRNHIKNKPQRPRRQQRKFYLWSSWVSFLPDHTLDFMLDARDLPVKEESDGTSAQLETGKQLGSVDGMDRINSFVFDEYAFINQEIGPISTIKHDLFVANRTMIFSVDIQSAQAEFNHQATPNHGFQQSWSKCWLVATAESTIGWATSSLSITLSN